MSVKLLFQLTTPPPGLVPWAGFLIHSHSSPGSKCAPQFSHTLKYGMSPPPLLQYIHSPANRGYYNHAKRSEIKLIHATSSFPSTLSKYLTIALISEPSALLSGKAFASEASAISLGLPSISLSDTASSIPCTIPHW